MTLDDLATFESVIEAPCETAYGDYTVYSARPWCQGPVLLQMLNLLENFDLQAMGHNSADYIHTLVEAMKLAFADRHRYYGDPDVVDVPIAGLLSSSYARDRSHLVRADRAWPEMPPAGEPWRYQRQKNRHEDQFPMVSGSGLAPDNQLDTSYVCSADQWGNIACAVPSDMTFSGPVVPGTGVVISTRGSQSWLETGHPSSVTGGKRPRLTPTPHMMFKRGRPYLVLGTPGGDTQCQTILQVFLNLVLFDLDPQEAVEAPRFATFNFPNSFYPHDYHPALVRIEDRFATPTIDHLKRMGHRLEKWPPWAWKAGGTCLIRFDNDNQTYCGAADPRRESYALGW
jgi:gamma-glutamyltranspeptidase/glutathione hydrolase